MSAVKVTDALAFLEVVKRSYADRPEVYQRFLDIMKDFKAHLLDTPGVLAAVMELFGDNVELIEGFNVFLPPGHHIPLVAGDAPSHSAPVGTPPPPPNPAQFDQARDFVIRKQFISEPQVYKAFLDILHNYRARNQSVREVHASVARLFKDHPDLLAGFREFLPEEVKSSAASTLHQPFAKLSLRGRRGLAPPSAESGSDGASVTVGLRKDGDGDDRFDAGVAIDFVLDLAPDQFSVALTSSGGRAVPLEVYQLTRPNVVAETDEEEAKGTTRYSVRLPTPGQAKSILQPGQESLLWVEVRDKHHALLFRRAVTFACGPLSQ